MRGTPEEILAAQMAQVAQRAAAQVAPLAGRHAVAFPYDDPQTTIAALRTARTELEHVMKGLAVLEALYGIEPPAERVDQDALRRAAEAEADKRAAQRKEAPTVVLRPPGEPIQPQPASPGKAWKTRGNR